ncbi:hypothetical protein L1987_57585 [Smallanthus sonchifolius]|uniref:Uncharacterized protein n=1 Tax=Smallanthus sonchifolius TaxID=185202 RepID=A0ACB9DD38_9ASTR|nr:hypothetical protein L1987_57585 [Smallanthus sonchifolius]
MAHIKQFEHLKIPLEALKLATNNFADENFIGRGGFGKNYKEKLVHNSSGETMIALKRLNRAFGQGDPRENRLLMTEVVEALEIALKYQENMHDIVGMTDVDLSRLTPDKLHIQTHYIQYMGKSQGKRMVELVYKPFKHYTSFSDACPLQKAPVVGGGLLSIKNTCDPIWEEEFIFKVANPPRNDKLHLEVISTPWDELVHRKEEYMGYANISLYDFGYETEGDLRVELQWRTSD